MIDAAANYPKEVVHTAVKEVEGVLDTANGLFDELLKVAGASGAMVDTEAKAVLDKLEAALDDAYTKVTDLSHLTKPAA